MGVNLVHRITAAVAEQEGVDPEALETPLKDTVDTDMIHALDSCTGDQQTSAYPVVEFLYYGYTVWVDGNGTITVSEPAGTTERYSTEPRNRLSDNRSGEMDHRKAAMKKATDVIAARERPFDERLDGLLEIVRNTLAVESATLSYVNDDAYVFEAVDTTPSVEQQAGEVVALPDTVCKRVVETEQPLVLRDVLVDAPELTGSAIGVASYIGVPVFVDGEVYGTFCFYDSNPRDEGFSEWELTFVELLSRWVSSELERRDRERALAATTIERPSNRS